MERDEIYRTFVASDTYTAQISQPIYWLAYGLDGTGIGFDPRQASEIFLLSTATVRSPVSIRLEYQRYRVLILPEVKRPWFETVH
jgi:hypothetical protein